MIAIFHVGSISIFACGTESLRMRNDSMSNHSTIQPFHGPSDHLTI